MKKLTTLFLSLLTCNLAFAHNEEAFFEGVGILLLIHIVIVFLDYKFNGKSVGGSILLFLLFFVGLYCLFEFSAGKYISSETENKYFLLIVVMFVYVLPLIIKILIMKMYRLRKK